ncbi:LysR family transcriptional regulator [Bordetella avium]|uniref:LysR-family transcriptional regulator n=1 Tax=Bordetella avium (strain 197N) TaxID=360910 RepID=Q2L0Y8_BORA1|nr:LysR substrate-binding domain-containing protein [Bordetella avium]AZY52507.1 LysR family transcriptional regulator [Bordetella avium]RIQ12297.1 LysR family transcriptional regulator [Bordetella avium]RIQ19329.1 LysR family transcriptional regulator [Bordetella avium]RIQ33497.1 LysR family transcriptional regulator [Bordetella avium]RIQ36016.1 LysR family transcriptional regulator [Bordetella avium]
MDWTHKLRRRHIRMLLSLAQTHNLSHSAVVLNTTQPGLSKWLKDLEDDIGLPLFERHARGLVPTPYGEVLIAHAQRIDSQLDRANKDMEALREGGSGRVVIGASGVAASDTAPLAMMRMLERMPRARVSLVEGTTDRLTQQLAQGDLDLVVGRADPEFRDPMLEMETLFVDHIHLVVRPRHPLLHGLAPDWEGVRAYRWIVWPKGTPVRNALDNALDEAGQTLPPDVIESNSVTANLTLLNNSDMIGVASHRAALRLTQLNAIRILPIRLSGFGSVAMYWSRDAFMSQAVRLAMACLREVAAGAAS